MAPLTQPLPGLPPLRKRRARFVIIALALLAGGIGTALPAESSLEQAVKASYLVKFAPFVEWPAHSFASADSPFVICVAGQDPFGVMLDDAARYQKIGRHPVVLRRLGAGSATGCHILFAGRGTPPEMLAVPNASAMLTISDRSAGTDAGMIAFVTQGGRVRFRIDDRAARAGGLVISSKLLGLAVAVDKR